MTLPSTAPSARARPPAPPPLGTDYPAFLLRPLPELVRPKQPTIAPVRDELRSLPAWRAVRTLPAKELVVAEALADPTSSYHLDVPEVYCPRFPASYLVRHRLVERVVPYLSTYLFARWDARDARLWHELRALPGVASFLGGALPTPVPDAEIAALRALIGPDGELLSNLAPLRPKTVPLGSTVRMTDGPFVTYVGTAVSHDDDGFLVGVEFPAVLGRSLVIKQPAQYCEVIELSDATPDPSGTARKERKRGRRGGDFRRSQRYHSWVR